MDDRLQTMSFVSEDLTAVKVDLCFFLVFLFPSVLIGIDTIQCRKYRTQYGP